MIDTPSAMLRNLLAKALGALLQWWGRSKLASGQKKEQARRDKEIRNAEARRDREKRQPRLSGERLLRSLRRNRKP